MWSNIWHKAENVLSELQCTTSSTDPTPGDNCGKYNEGQRSRGPSEAQVKEINDLKGELIGVEFIDEGIKWKIVDVKWNGKYLKIMVYYYDTDKYKRVPPVSDQEYSTVNLIREMLPGNNL